MWRYFLLFAMFCLLCTFTEGESNEVLIRSSHFSKVNQSEYRTKPTVLVGMMVSDTEPLRKIEAHRRSLKNFTDLGKSQCEIILFFFFGRSKSKAAIYGPDIVRGNFLENMNSGKTREWIIWAVKWFRRHRKYANPRSVVIKMDSDTAVKWALLDSHVTKFKPSTYFGRITRKKRCKPELWVPCLGGVLPYQSCHCLECTVKNAFDGDCWLYMSGGFYGVSLSIAEKLSKCWQHSFHGPEDALFALAIKRCQIPVQVRKVDGVFRHSTLLKDRSVEEVDVWGNTTR